MKINQSTIKILHGNHGVLLEETFENSTQFKLFLKMVHGCVELKNDLTFFNGVDFFIHIPYSFLVESIITTTNIQPMTLTEQMSQKSKIESPITK